MTVTVPGFPTTAEPELGGVPKGGSLIPTLAGRFYTDPALFAREQRDVFEAMWFCAVRSGDLATAGSF